MRAVFLALVATTLVPLFGWDQSHAIVTGCPTQLGTPVWALPVRVMTQSLRVVENLQARDFVVTENRLPQRVCGFVHVRQPVSMGILLDTSGSMGAPRYGLAVARAGINQFLDSSGPQDEYFLEYVNDAPAMKCIFSCDLRHIRAGLQVSPKGATAVIDSVYLALDAMRRKARHAIRALLVISDGGDNKSVYTSDELTRAFADAPVPIFLITPTDRSQPAPQLDQERLAHDGLVRLANQSGGYAISVVSAKEMSAAITELAAAIRAPYMLCFARSPSQVAVPLQKVRVQVKGMRRPILLYRAAIRYAQ